MPKSRNLEGGRYAVSRPPGIDRGPKTRPRSLFRSITRSKFGKGKGAGFFGRLMAGKLRSKDLPPGKASP